MDKKQYYPYRKPNIGDVCVAGPNGQFDHYIEIYRVTKSMIFYETAKYGKGSWDLDSFRDAIKEGYWKYKYNFNHYLKQAELCIK